jgi:predicted unusual protein kinase regulating ubiquinone biosynthesis (AarF/ABC1/UbiB family)
MVENLLMSLEEQLVEETQFKLEAEHDDSAAKLYETFNQEFTDKLKGWKFEVPRATPGSVIRDDVMFIDLAKGLSFDELSAEQRKLIGPVLVETSQSAFFNHGEFDPDRHQGNWRFDPETKTIYPLDFGQLEKFTKEKSKFTPDDRFTVARTLQAIQEKDASSLSELAMQMARPNSHLVDEAGMNPELDAALNSGEELKDVLVKIIGIWAEHGIYLQKKYFFGALKGFIVLAGEQYVPPDEFQELTAKYARAAIVRKWPLVAPDAARKALNKIQLHWR